MKNVNKKLLLKNHNAIINTVDGINKKILKLNKSRKNKEINILFSQNIIVKSIILTHLKYKYKDINIQTVKSANIIISINLFLFIF